MAYEIPVKLGTNPNIKAGLDNRVGKKFSQAQTKESKTSPLPLLWESYKNIKLNHIFRGPTSDP